MCVDVFLVAVQKCDYIKLLLKESQNYFQQMMCRYEWTIVEILS